MRPDGVVESDASVKRFYSILESAYSEITAELNGASLSTASRRKAQQKQIESIIAKADKDIRDWISIEVPAQYEQGAFDTMSDLIQRGDDPRTKASFTNFHREAIEAIAQDMYASASEGLSGVARSSSRVISASARESVLERLAKGQIKGDSLTKIKKDVASILESEGLTAITDKRGNSWDLLRYAEMLSRTKLTQAHNSGVANRMAESGYDLVIVSNHSGSCRLCAPFEGKVLSVTGRNRGYTSVREAERNGLFHPNCRHVYSPYHKGYLDQAVGWDAELQKYRPFRDVQRDIIARNKQLLIDFAKGAKWGTLLADSVVGDAFDVKFSDSKREYKYTMNGFEKSLAEKRGLTTAITKKRSNAGSYVPLTNEVNLNLTNIEKVEKTLGAKEASKTFYHEIGHFIDYQLNDRTEVRSGIYQFNKLTKQKEIVEALKQDGKTVVYDRVSSSIKAFEKEHGLQSNDGIESLIQSYLRGEKIKSKDGQKYVAVSKKTVRYLSSFEEVFADGYAQYRLDPEGFKKRAPKLFKVFKDLEGSI